MYFWFCKKFFCFVRSILHFVRRICDLLGCILFCKNNFFCFIISVLYFALKICEFLACVPEGTLEIIYFDILPSTPKSLLTGYHWEVFINVKRKMFRFCRKMYVKSFRCDN